MKSRKIHWWSKILMRMEGKSRRYFREEMAKAYRELAEFVDEHVDERVWTEVNRVLKNSIEAHPAYQAAISVLESGRKDIVKKVYIQLANDLPGLIAAAKGEMRPDIPFETREDLQRWYKKGLRVLRQRAKKK